MPLTPTSPSPAAYCKSIPPTHTFTSTDKTLSVSITVNKNVWGYGFSKFITNWAIKSGFVPPIMTNASLILLWCLFGILFYYKGKTFRRWSKNSSVHRMGSA